MPPRMLVVALVIALGWPLRAAEPAPQLDELLTDMDLHGSSFDAKGLHALGVTGLEGVLDRFFPDTAKAVPKVSVPEDEIKRLIGQLGSDEFRLREESTEKLIARGKSRKELLLKAADSDDAEVRLRARRILAAWEPREVGSAETSLSGFWKYAEGIKDRERLEVLARRTVAELSRGWPESPKLHLLRLCIASVAKGGDAKSCELLRPLIAHQDVRVAKLVAETAGSYKTDNRFFPPLLVDALQSPRDEVVQVAIRWSQDCQDPARTADVRRALRAIFDKRDEALKFQACLTLCHDFDDADAWAYLLEQTQSTESLRAASALAWLADAKPTGRPLPQDLAAKVAPHLRSPKLALRWAAAKTLGIHAGADVIQLLIPLLGDAESSVHEEAKRCLANQPDKDTLQRLLAQAADGHMDEKVKARAKELLARLSEK